MRCYSGASVHMVEPISLTLGIAVGASVSLAVALFGEEEEEDRRREEEEVPHSPHTRHSPAAHLDLRA